MTLLTHTTTHIDSVDNPHAGRPWFVFRLAWLLPALLLVLLAACSEQPPYALASDAQLPEFLQDAPIRVREAYRFAIANPDELAKYPCYCGCNLMGHKSNLHCYITEVSLPTTPEFDTHASGCGICVDITQDVMRLLREGKHSPEIRTYIDAQYSRFGPSTDTPLPVE